MKELLLTHGKSAQLDDEDYERLKDYNYSYRAKDASNPTEVIFRNVPGGKTSYIQNDVLLIEPPKRVKYIDGNRLNLQKSNLIITDVSNVQQGAKRNIKNKTSPFVGVSWNKKNQNWKSTIYKDKKQYHIGFFEDQLAAAEAYNKKAIELFGEYANLNDLSIMTNLQSDTDINMDEIKKRKLLPRSPKRRKNISVYRGVTFRGADKKLKEPWIAMIAHTTIGYYTTAKEAAIAYNVAAIKMYGKKRAILNLNISGYCTKCDNITEINPATGKLYALCKSCREYHMELHWKHKEANNIRSLDYYYKNKKQLLPLRREKRNLFYQHNKESHSQYQRKNKERANKYNRDSYRRKVFRGLTNDQLSIELEELSKKINEIERIEGKLKRAMRRIEMINEELEERSYQSGE